MNIRCDKNQLQTAIQITQRFASSKSTLPVLSGIMLVATPGQIALQATDLEVSITCTIPADVSEEGEIVASARYLNDLVRRLPEGTLELVYDNQQNLLDFRYGKSHFQLSSMNADDFPQLPDIEAAGAGCVLPPPLFRDSVRQVGIAASSDQLRPIFTGVLCEFGSNQLSLVTTDTHRLARKLIALQEQSEAAAADETPAASPLSVLVPQRALQELARLLREDGSELQIVVGQGLVGFKTDDFYLTVRPLEGKFPDYERVIPAAFKTTLQTDRSELLAALERASLLVSSRDGSSIVHLEGDGSELIVSSQAANLGSVREELSCELSGEPLNIYFNARYLIEGLRVLNGQQAQMHFSGALSPCVIRGTDESDYLYLLLPVRY